MEKGFYFWYWSSVFNENFVSPESFQTCYLCLFFFPYKPQKKEDQQSEAKASPKKSSEPTIDLLGLGKQYIITWF